MFSSSLTVRIAFAAAFFLFFYLRNDHYLPTTVSWRFNEQAANRVTHVVAAWDSGRGFNTHVWIIPAFSPRFTERSIPLPNLYIKRVSLTAYPRGIGDVFNGTTVRTRSGVLLETKGHEGGAVILDFPPSGRTGLHPVLLTVQLVLAILASSLLTDAFLYCRRRASGGPRGMLRTLTDGHKPLFWAMFLLLMAVSTFWLLGQYPAIMTYDSFVVFSEIKILAFDNFSPCMFGILVLMITQFWDSPTAVCVFQMMVSSFFASFLFYYALRGGVRWYLLLPFFIAFAASVPVGAYNVTIWKDVPFSMLVLFWAFFLFHLLRRASLGAPVLLDARAAAYLSVALFFLSSLRHNGIVYLFVIPLAMFLIMGKHRTGALRVALLSFAMYAVLRLVIVGALAPDKDASESYNHNNNYLNTSWKINTVACFLKNGYYSPDHAHDKSVIGKVADPDFLAGRYNPLQSGEINWTQHIIDRLNRITPAEMAEFDSFHLRAIFDNLDVYMSDRIRTFMAVFFRGQIFANDLRRNKIWGLHCFGFYLSPKLGVASQWQNGIIDGMEQYSGAWGSRFLLANGLWGLLLLCAAFILYRFIPASACFAFVPLVQMPFLFVTLPSTEFRYVYYVYLSAFFMVPFVLLEMVRRKSTPLSRGTVPGPEA